MALHEWQQEIVRRHPWEFLRGAIFTDGAVYRNWTVTPAGRRHEYLTYSFRNRSAEILRHVFAAGVAAGLQPSMQRESVVFARRADVARLVSHIGTKQTVDVAALWSAWTLGAVFHGCVEALWFPEPKEAEPTRCCDCGSPISRGRRRCKPCAGIARGGTVEWPSYEMLLREVRISSVTAVARRLGVSETAVRKRLRRHQAQRERRRAA